MRKTKIKKITMIILGVAIIITAIVLLEIQKNNAISDCVNAGNSYTFCESGLR